MLTGGLGDELFVLYSLEGVHSESDVHAGAVREEGSQSGLLEQSKDQDLVPETHRGTLKDHFMASVLRVSYSSSEESEAQQKKWNCSIQDGSCFILTSCPVGRQSSSWSYR